MSKHTLILGGAKSGKTGLALALAEQRGKRPIYLATAQAADKEMARRIANHQAERGPRWSTVEEPLNLEQALIQADGDDKVLLVDCLTMWLSNLMMQEDYTFDGAEQRCRDLADMLPELKSPVILVGNEVGLGIVPENAMARAFRDLAGGLHQQLGRVCGQVVLVAAGLSLVLKGPKLDV